MDGRSRRGRGRRAPRGRPQAAQFDSSQNQRVAHLSLRRFYIC